MPFTKVSRYKGAVGTAVSLLVVWYVTFEWDWLTYTDGGPTAQERCYSPNHEYYIVRYQSLVRALLPLTFEPAFGTAILYDKLGKRLYSGKTFLDFQAGPLWGGGTTVDGEKYSVWFMGDSNDWLFILPSPPGEDFSIPEKHCF